MPKRSLPLTLLGFIALAGCCALFLIQCSPENRPAHDDLSGFEPLERTRIVGYVFGSRRPDISRIPAEKLTHINYAFANLIDNRIVLQESDRAHLQELRRLKMQNPDLRFLVSVGGWSWSGNFSDAALTEESRREFALSARDIIRDFDLDGVDIDWEYPAQPGAGNVYRPEDKQNFTLMLREVRRELECMSDEEGRTGLDRYKLTIATGANQRFLDLTEMDKAHRYLDFVNIMTYDFHGGWSQTTGHHANLHPNASESGRLGASDSVELHINAGIPVQKLVLGVPFYGRGWSGVRALNNGLFQPFESAVREPGYGQLVANFINKNGFVRYWDDEAKAPWLWNEQEGIMYTYEDPQSLQYKTDYIRSMGMSGAMYWEHTHDPDLELLGVLARELLGVE